MARTDAQISRALRWVAPLLWGGAILWLSLTPSPPSVPSLLSWDKLRHALAYALLTLLLGRALVPLWSRPRAGWDVAAALAVGYGAVMELAQGLLTEARCADVGDLLANAAGAAAVLLAVRRRNPRRAP